MAGGALRHSSSIAKVFVDHGSKLKMNDQLPDSGSSYLVLSGT